MRDAEQDEAWALASQPRREIPAKPIYIDDATGVEVDADWWPGDPLPGGDENA